MTDKCELSPPSQYCEVSKKLHTNKRPIRAPLRLRTQATPPLQVSMPLFWNSHRTNIAFSSLRIMGLPSYLLYIFVIRIKKQNACKFLRLTQWAPARFPWQVKSSGVRQSKLVFNVDRDLKIYNQPGGKTLVQAGHVSPRFWEITKFLHKGGGGGAKFVLRSGCRYQFDKVQSVCILTKPCNFNE
jgi:hypothetical protein